MKKIRTVVLLLLVLILQIGQVNIAFAQHVYRSALVKDMTLNEVGTYKELKLPQDTKPFAVGIYPKSTLSFESGKSRVNANGGPAWDIITDNDVAAVFRTETPKNNNKVYKPIFYGKFKGGTGKGGPFDWSWTVKGEFLMPAVIVKITGVDATGDVTHMLVGRSHRAATVKTEGGVRPSEWGVKENNKIITNSLDTILDASVKVYTAKGTLKAILGHLARFTGDALDAADRAQWMERVDVSTQNPVEVKCAIYRNNISTDVTLTFSSIKAKGSKSTGRQLFTWEFDWKNSTPEMYKEAVKLLLCQLQMMMDLALSI